MTDRNTLSAISTNGHLFKLSDLDFKLNVYSRKMVVASIIFYITIPIAYYYGHLGWSFIDSIYFCTVSFTSVGYGDIIPHTIDQRMITCMFLLLGVAVTGNLLGIVSSISLEAKQEQMKERQTLMRTTAREIEPEKESPKEDNSLTKLWSCITTSTRKYFDYLTFFTKQENAISRAEHARLQSIAYPLPSETPTETSDTRTTGTISHDLTEKDRLASFQKAADCRMNEMQKQYRLDLQDMRFSFFIEIVVIFCMIFTGMFSMIAIEGWSGADAFYWSVVSITTVGYGDVVPTTDAGKVFTMVYIAFGCAFMAKSFSELVMAPITMRAKKNEMRVIGQFESEMSEYQFNDIIHNPVFVENSNLRKTEKEITKSEFALAILNIMGTINDEDVARACQIFDKYNSAGNGTLTTEEIKNALELARMGDKERRTLELHKRRSERIESSGLEEETNDKQRPVFDRTVSETDANISPIISFNREDRKRSSSKPQGHNSNSTVATDTTTPSHVPERFSIQSERGSALSPAISSPIHRV